MLEVSTAVRATLDAMRRARAPLAMYTLGILTIQSLTGVFGSPDLLSRKAVHTSDASALVISLLVQSYLWCGALNTGLRSGRFQKVSLSDLIVGPSAFLRLTSVGIVAVVPVCLGLLLLIFPGAYLALMWSQAAPFLLDGRARLFDSLRMSAQLTTGVRGRLFLAFLVPGLLELPARIIDRLSTRAAWFESLLGSAVLLLVGTWQILVSAFACFLAAILYCRLLESHAEVGTSRTPDATVGEKPGSVHA